MNVENVFTLVQQSIAIIITIVLLYLMHNWLTRSLDFEEQRKLSINFARQVRRRAFQESLVLLQGEVPFSRRNSRGQGKLEEQDGIK